MHVDDFLSTAPLPDVAVDAEAALARTRSRGTRRRRRRGSLAGLGVVFVVVTGAVAGLRAGSGEEPDQVVTGSDESVTTSLPPAEPEPGDPATWRIDPDALPSPTASTFTVLVSRIGCHGGETGRVLRPGVVFDDGRVVVTFTVEDDTGEGIFTCQGNDEVAHQVDIGQPIGDRALVDGNCAASGPTGPCLPGQGDDGVRWQPLEPPFRTVSGVLEMTGGPASAPPTPVPGTIYAYDDVERPVAATTADDAGRFTLQLPAGTYRLVGYSPSYVDGEWECATADPVAVADADVENVSVACLRR